MSKQYKKYFKLLESTPLRSGDEVYIMNQKEWCALTPAGFDEKWILCSGERVKATYMGSASTWRYVKGSGGDFQLIALGNLLYPDRKYLSWADKNHVILVDDSAKCAWKKEDYRTLQGYTRDTGNPETTLYYGRPYIIKHKYYKNNLGLDEKFDVSALNIQSGTEKWIFWPAKSPSGMDPKCAFYHSFGATRYDEDTNEFKPLGYIPRCGDPNFLMSECSGVLNNFCSKQSNVFVKPNNCDAYLRENPNGRADDALKSLCSNINYELMRDLDEYTECGCIAPILDQGNAPSRVKDDITLDWSCYGVTCTNNNDAWRLSNQKNVKCSGNTLCIMNKVKAEAGGDVIYEMDCGGGGGGGGDQGSDRPKKRGTEWWKIVLLLFGAGVVIYGGYRLLTYRPAQNTVNVYDPQRIIQTPYSYNTLTRPEYRYNLSRY